MISREEKKPTSRDFKTTTGREGGEKNGNGIRNTAPNVKRQAKVSEQSLDVANPSSGLTNKCIDESEQTGSEEQDGEAEVKGQSLLSEMPSSKENPSYLTKKCIGDVNKCGTLSANDTTVRNNLEGCRKSSSELEDENISNTEVDSVADSVSGQPGEKTSTKITPRGVGDKINPSPFSLHTSNTEPEVRNELSLHPIWDPATLSKTFSGTEELETANHKEKQIRDYPAAQILDVSSQILHSNTEVAVDSPHIDHYEEGIHWYGSAHEAPSIRNIQPEVIVQYLSTSNDLPIGSKSYDCSLKAQSIGHHEKEICPIQPKDPIPDEVIIEVTKRSNGNSLSRLELFALTVANIFMSFFSVGSIFGLGVLFVAIIDAFQSTRAEAAPVMSVYIGILYIGGGVVGPLMNKYNGGYICMVGGVLGCIGCIISSFAPSIPYLIVGTGVLAGSAVAIGYFLPFIVTRDIFDEHRTTMLTVMDITPGIGGVVFPYMTSQLLEEYGWRGVFLIYAGLMFHCVPIGYLNAVVKRRYSTTSEMETTSFKDMFNYSLLKKPTFLILLFNMILMFGLFPAVNIFFVDVAREKGFDIQTASAILSVNGFCNVAARVAIIVATPFITLSRLGQWTVYVPVLSFVTFSYIYATTYNELLVLGVVFGAFWGLTNVSYSSAILEVSGPKLFLPALAYCSLTGGVTCLFLSPAVGALRDLTGSYDCFYYLTSGLGFFSSVLLAIITVKAYLDRRRANKKARNDNSVFVEKYTPRPDGVLNPAFYPALRDVDIVRRTGAENDGSVEEIQKPSSGP